MNHLIEIYEIEGDPVDKKDRVKCTVYISDTDRTICGYALDAFRTVEFTESFTKRGGITCPACMETIKQIKEIKF